LNYELYPKSATDYFVYAVMAALEALPAWFQKLNSSWQLIFSIVVPVLFLAVCQYAGKRLDQSEWGKRHNARVKASLKIQAFGSAMEWPIIIFAAIFCLPLVTALILVAPVAVGQSAGREVGLRDKAAYAKGCADAPRGYFCVTVNEGGTRLAGGFLVDASPDYLAIADADRSLSIPRAGKSLSDERRAANADAHTITRDKDGQ
jgi:hypothetical protein